MAWGTSFTTQVDILRMEFRSLTDLREQIKEKEEEVATIEQRIAVLCTADPSTVLSSVEVEEGWSVMEFKQKELKEYFEELGELHRLLQKMYLAQMEGEENWSNIKFG